MCKIVVLDHVALTQNDLSLDVLNKYGRVDLYERTPKDKVIEYLADAEIALTNKVVIDKAVIDACPSLKYISILATGYNVVDCDYAKQKGIRVSNVPAYSTDSVAQHTFALILELCSKVGINSDLVKKGEWVKSPDFCLCMSNLIELSGKTLGIIGYGNIGKSVAKIATAFGMKILINNRTPFTGCVDREYLFINSDIVTLHCPLNQDNEKMINKETLKLMKKSAFLINTSRGGLIDEDALAYALKNGEIAKAAVDVLSTEPPKMDNPLLDCTNCIITPHIAWATLEARLRLLNITCSNIEGYLTKNLINLVN
ncbi:MAG TPA: D-2-hydroxyacid dehydrogenase [Clostridia bacterium]|nr:D-2-hydroxyacid dehydrogenase [Clostridia bacterium]